MMGKCARCDGCRWVYEAHRERPLEGPVACGAAGMPCPICNTGDPPEIPPGFKVDTDENGSRH
jgi:hypothetical protein